MAKTGIACPHLYTTPVPKKSYKSVGILCLIALAGIVPTVAMAQGPDVSALKPRFSVSVVKPCDPKASHGHISGPRYAGGRALHEPTA
jgi:hypothetical protein